MTAETVTRVLNTMSERFTSSNSIPVERAFIKRAEWDAVVAELLHSNTYREGLASAGSSAAVNPRRSAPLETPSPSGDSAALSSNPKLDYVEALRIADAIFETYRTDWPSYWRKLEGTPIRNDLAVRIAQAFANWAQLHHETKARHYSVGDLDLSPCPFCASTDFDLTRRPDPSPPSYPDGVWVIECGGCGALGPFCEEIENAPKAWNDCKRRALKTGSSEADSPLTSDRHQLGTTVEERSDKCEHGIPRRFCTGVHK